MVPIVWKLKPGSEKRVRSGHPWVFSNELSVSPKGLPPGNPVELQDARGQFVARGYGNPHSLISFRALSFHSQDAQPWSHASLREKVLDAWRVRKNAGFRGSFRLCFGESDYIPGLVCDYYLIESQGQQAQVFCAQLVTAGMNLALSDLEGFFKELVEAARSEGLSKYDWNQTAVVLRNDVNIRKLEGLAVEEPRVVKSVDGFELSHATILLNASQDQGLVKMSCDLQEGQKTGFFLDQTQNIFLFTHLLQQGLPPGEGKLIRVLDLCCYVGHWSTQITRVLKSKGYQVEVSQLDVSETALHFARENAEREGAQVLTLKMDVLEKLPELASAHYDIVIADPPAFIKAKKDIPTGKHAYLKMNTQAFRLIKKGGYVVSCSCSGLLTEEDFQDVLRKSGQRNFAAFRSILRGGHAADHPTLMQFPEGFYLKMYTHYLP